MADLTQIGSPSASSSKYTQTPKSAGYTPRKPSFRIPIFGSTEPDHAASYSSSIYDAPEALGKRRIDIASEPLSVNATLRERLDAWRDAPGGRGEIEDEIELGGFVQWNLEVSHLVHLTYAHGSSVEIHEIHSTDTYVQQCDTISEQHNTHMIQKSVNVWATMNRTTLHQHRMTLINHMEDALERNLTEQYGEGRGIVLVAGNADTLTRVKWMLKMLRSYGSELPVQIVSI
jgi:alpha 1,2-mannosyltransferase